MDNTVPNDKYHQDDREHSNVDEFKVVYNEAYFKEHDLILYPMYVDGGVSIEMKGLYWNETKRQYELHYVYYYTGPSPDTCGFGYDPIFFVREKDCAMAELTPEEKDLFSNPERMKKYVKTLEDATEQRFLYLDKAKRLQGEGKKSEAERARKTAQAFEDMITSGTFLKTKEDYEAWKTRDSKMSKLASLRNELATAKGVNKREKLLSEINRLENDLGIKQTRLPQKYTDKYGTNFEALNISDMTVPAQTASSMNGGGIGKLEQNADMVINITGDESTAKQIGQEVGNAVFNAFQASAQQIVGGN